MDLLWKSQVDDVDVGMSDIDVGRGRFQAHIGLYSQIYLPHLQTVYIIVFLLFNKPFASLLLSLR